MTDEELVRANMQAIAAFLKNELPKGWAFILLVTPFGPPGTGNVIYVANTQREDAINAMKEFIRINEDHSKFGTDESR